MLLIIRKTHGWFCFSLRKLLNCFSKIPFFTPIDFVSTTNLKRLTVTKNLTELLMFNLKGTETEDVLNMIIPQGDVQLSQVSELVNSCSESATLK